MPENLSNSNIGIRNDRRLDRWKSNSNIGSNISLLALRFVERERERESIGIAGKEKEKWPFPPVLLPISLSRRQFLSHFLGEWPRPLVVR